jgi:hypothetical protein
MTHVDRTQKQQQVQHPITSATADEGTRSSFMHTTLDWLAHYILPGSQQPNPATEENSNKPQHWRYENVTAPAAVDWRQHKPTVLGAIKDQHVNGTPCGSCWAFSAVSIMEIASAMASGMIGEFAGSQRPLCNTAAARACT